MRISPENSQRLGFVALFLCIIIALLVLGSLIYFIASNGIKAFSWTFFTDIPRKSMTAGGVGPAIVGTLYLVLGSLLFSVPLGVVTAIYLCEYSPKNYTLNLIRMSINNLAGVPSVVFGLFGLSIFVKLFGFNVSILSGSLTLGILVLPGIISASYEAILSVPQSTREASYALGANQIQTIKKVVLPAALPGILTGMILAVGRAAGETAPIMFTAATFYSRSYPSTIMTEVMALPYHIYVLMTEGTKPDLQVVIAYGCALILLILVLSVSAIAIYLRQKQRRKYA